MPTGGRQALFVIVCSAAFSLAACGGDRADSDQSVLAGDTAQADLGADTTSTSSRVEEAAALPESPSTVEPGTTTSVAGAVSTAAAEAPTSIGEVDDTAGMADLVDLVGGGQLDLNSIEGSDTVLWFWAPW